MGNKMKKISCSEGNILFGMFRRMPEFSPRNRVYGVAGKYCKDGYGQYPNFLCAPCQTIKYICPSVTSKVRVTNICPNVFNKDGTGKSEKQLYTEARGSVWRLFEKGCQIQTPGFFYDEFKNWIKQKGKGAKLIHTANYSCKAKMKGRSKTVRTNISVPLVPNESPKKTKIRLEKAARSKSGKIKGCRNAKLTDLVPAKKESNKIKH